MKTLFQLLMTASLLLIIMDISSCSRQHAHQEMMQLREQFIDIVTKRPVSNLQLCMEETGQDKCISTTADNEGNFVVSIPSSENHDYSLYVQDARYTIVNPHQHVGAQETHQVWYLLPKGATP